MDAIFEKQWIEMENAALDAMPRIIIPAYDNQTTGIWNTVRNWVLQPSN